MATRRRRSPGTQGLGRQLHLDSGRSIAAVARSIGIHEMTLGKKGEERKGIGQIHGQDLSRPNLPSWNGLATTTPPDGWSVISQKVATREGTAVKYERSRTGPQRQHPVRFMCNQLWAVRPGLIRTRRNAPTRAAIAEANCRRSSDRPTCNGNGQARSRHCHGRRLAQSRSAPHWARRPRSCGLFVPVRPL